MQIFVEGIKALYVHSTDILILLVGTVGLGVWITDFLLRGSDHHTVLSLFFSFPVGMCIISLLILLSNLLKLSNASLHWLSIFLIIAALVLLTCWGIPHFPKSRRNWVGLLSVCVIYLVYLVMRLAFLTSILLPPYSDSVFHVRLINAFLIPGGVLTFLNQNGYYHAGIHALVVWLCALTNKSAIQLLPLFGQLIIVEIPFTFAGFVLLITKRKLAAGFGAVFAALGWSMPAFVANWGKYPSLAAVLLIPVIAGLAYYLIQDRWQFILKSICLFLIAAISILFQSRLLALFITLGVVYFWVKFSRKWQPMRIARVIATTLLISLVIAAGLSRGLLTPYIYPITTVTLLVCLAIPLAVLYSPNLTQGSCLFAILILLWTKVTLPSQVFPGAVSLFDLPFLQVIFFLPLSFLVVIGITSALDSNRKLSPRKNIFAGVLLCLILVSGLRKAQFFPDSCCNWVHEQDLKVFEWIKDNLPPATVVYIPGSEGVDKITGTDAGIWISQITGITTKVLPYDYEWFAPNIRSSICENSPNLIYKSNMPFSFQIDGYSYPDSYSTIFCVENSCLLKILPCR